VSPRRDAFVAIADPTRRAVLDLLADRASMTAGEIAYAFPEITRPAVSKHLRILREAGLVSVHRDGREQRYALDVRPLAEMYARWLSRFEPLFDESLVRLKQRVEGRRQSRQKASTAT
jgi:DNA-binding transcriptional ArsR family regulator